MSQGLKPGWQITGNKAWGRGLSNRGHTGAKAWKWEWQHQGEITGSGGRQGIGGIGLQCLPIFTYEYSQHGQFQGLAKFLRNLAFGFDQPV